MEKEIPKQESWVPQTPAKPTPPSARPNQVYVKTFVLPEKVCYNEAPMTSSAVTSTTGSSASLVFNWKEAESCIAAVFTQLLCPIDTNTQNLLLTNTQESHIPQSKQCIFQDLHDDVGTGVLTPSEKQNKRPKVKKHRPKVVVDWKLKKTPKPITPKPATPKRAYRKKKLNLSKKRNCSGQKATESCRRVLNFDLGNLLRDDESAITTTAIDRYQLQNTSVDDNSECPNKLQNDINLGSSYGEPTDAIILADQFFQGDREGMPTNTANSDTSEGQQGLLSSSSLIQSDDEQAKSSAKGYCKKVYKRIFQCLRISREVGPNFPTSKRSKKSMWMFPPRKSRTRIAVKKPKSFKFMLTLTPSTVQTRKRWKRYNRRRNLASLNAIPICDQLPKTVQQAQTIERDDIAFCTENCEKQESEIIPPEACNKSVGSHLEDFDLWLISKSRGPNVDYEPLRTDPILEPLRTYPMDPIMEPLRFDPIMEPLRFDPTDPIMESFMRTDPIMEHDALGVPDQVVDTLKSSELPGFDLNLPINTETLQFLDSSNDNHQIMEKDHNADSQCSTIISDPIRKRKPRNSQLGAIVPYLKPIARTKKRKRKWISAVDLDSESLSMWNLLTNDSETLKLLTNINKGEDEQKTDAEKEKWWKRERDVFSGRIGSFTSKMHQILGDRSFKKWKGSVVDSVVGVFLTQNVTDHASSSVFMSLAARFPIQSTSNHGASDNNNLEITHTQKSSGSNMTSDGLAYDLGGNQYFVTEPEPDTSCEPETSVAGVEGTILVDTEDSRTFHEGCCSEIHLSPDLSSEADLASPSIPYSMESCTTSTELSEFKNTAFLQESCSNGSEILKCDESPEYGNQTSSLDRSSDLNGGADASISLSNSQDPFEMSFYSVDRREILEDQGKYCVVTDCSSQVEVETEKNSLTCNSYQRTVNVQSQPISFVDGKVESQNSKMQPADDATHINKNSKTETATPRRKGKQVKKKEEPDLEAVKQYWEAIRKFHSKAEPRSSDQMDSVDWEAVRRADVSEIAEAIKARGQSNIIAIRIKDFLNRVVDFHGGIDLEWLRDIPPDLAKKYLLEIKGLGLKSVECLRLLSLEHKAFPVDTNVGRIAVRLGWVPLQPLPEELQLHLLNEYPMMDSIQKYLWPRLCTLDQKKLYELHYHFITFGKVICTKRNPNCNACPMRGGCKHFASAFASARLALPGPSEKRMVSSTVPIAVVENPAVVVNLKSVPLLKDNPVSESGYQTNYGVPMIEEPASPEPEHAESSTNYSEPIIEEPASPKPECPKSLELGDIEDYPYVDSEKIPIIKINEEQFKANLQDYLKSNMMLQNVNLSDALVALTAEAASIPSPKLKDISRLRAEHQVYEISDDDHILTELLQLEKLEKDDPSKYLLAIWTPGETPNSLEPPKPRCNSKGSEPCKDKECFTCNRDREERADIVRGTILIPCRTAMRGYFPLNGTYFQVNEVFADHETSHYPIDVPRKLLYDLRRRTVYFGTSTSSISKGLQLEAIQRCFWHGNICIRGFDRKERVTRNLVTRFYCPAHMKVKVKKKKEIIDEMEMSKNISYIMDAPPLDDTRGKN